MNPYSAMPNRNNRMDRRDTSFNRRHYLKTFGAAGAVGLAGCMGGGDDGDSGNSDTDGDSGNSDTTNGGTTSNKTLTVDLITDSTNPKQKEILRNAFDDWADQTSADVSRNFQFLGFQDALQKLNTTMAAGNPPNLIFLDMAAAARWRNKLADLSSLETALDISSDLTVRNKEGNSVFIPHDFGLAYQWVRTDIYEDAGLQAPTQVKDAWTWDEYLDILGQLDSHLSDSRMVPDLVFANPSSWLTSWLGDTDLATAGAQIVKRESKESETEVVLDKEPNRSRAIEALKFRRTIYENGWTPETVSYDVNKMYSAFGNGLTAGAQYGGRLLINLREQNPEIAKNITPAPFPVHPRQKRGESEYKQNMAAAGFFVPKQVENKDLLKSFIDFYFNSEWYIESLLAVPLHKVPLNPSIMEKEKYKQNEVVQQHPELKEFLKNFVYEYGQLTINKTDPPTPYYRDWAEWANQTPLPTMFGKAYTGRSEPGAAIDEAAQFLRDTQSQYIDR